MSLTTTPHLNLPGTAREALGFYREVFGGELSLTSCADVGMPAEEPGSERIVFGSVTAENGFRVMAYDVPGLVAAQTTSTTRQHGATITDATFFVAVRAGSLEEARGHWDRLGEGGVIIEPLAASAWSPGFGMLTDRFGVTWTIDVGA